uniref:Uncharacterized protein n=1 Tax=viral metagenome TaxID=1070528 RepID=A0A6M3XUK6_9ZZZZ
MESPVINVPDIFSNGLYNEYVDELRKVMKFPDLDLAKKIRERGVIEDLFPGFWKWILRLRYCRT